MPPAFTPLAGGPAGLQIISPVLTNVARQYRPQGFIYDQIVAPQPVATNVGQYPVFNLAKFYTARGDAAVADDAATPLVDFEWGTEFYNCQDYRLRTRLTRKETLQANAALRLEITKTTGLLGIMALEREKRLANALRSEGNGGKLTLAAVPVSGAKWDEGTEGSPAKIQSTLITAQQSVYKKTGLRPRTLVITEAIALAISQDPSVIKIIQYLGGTGFIESGNISGNPNLQAFGSTVLPKKLWGFDLVVADGVLENAAAEGATPSLSEVWGNTARLLYVNRTAPWGTPTIAYSFRGRVTGGYTEPLSQAPGTVGNVSQLEPAPISDQWTVVDRWQEPDPPAENIRAWECVDEHIVAPEAGVEIEAPLGKP